MLGFKSVISKMSKILGVKGQSTILFAAMLPVYVGAGSFAIEVGYIYMAKSQMQVAAEAAALAGVRELVVGDYSEARAQAASMVSSNSVAGHPIEIDRDNDVEFGRMENGSFVPQRSGANAVRVNPENR